MVIKTKTVLVGLENKPIMEKEAKDGQDGIDLTIGKVISSAMLFIKSDEPVRSFKLGSSFLQDEEVTLSSEDVVFIKKYLLMTNYTPIVIGQIVILLES